MVSPVKRSKTVMARAVIIWSSGYRQRMSPFPPGSLPSWLVVTHDHTRPKRGTAANHLTRRHEAAPPRVPCLGPRRSGGLLSSHIRRPERDCGAPGLLGSEPLTLFSNGWQPGRAGAGSPASCLGVSAGRADTKAIAALTANTAPSVRAQAMSRSPGRREKCFQLAIRPAGRGHRHRCSGPSGPSQHLYPGWHSCQPAGTLLSAATKHLNSPKQTDQQELSPCGPTSLAIG